MLLGAKVLRPNKVRQTHQPKHIKPFLLRITHFYYFFSKTFITNYLRDVKKPGIILRRLGRLSFVLESITMTLVGTTLLTLSPARQGR
jgi:hypothetical protein